MKTYQVSLARTYTVNIAAENEEKAKELTEFYTSHILDASTEDEREVENFLIQEIECQLNEAIDCTEVEDE